MTKRNQYWINSGIVKNSGNSADGHFRSLDKIVWDILKCCGIDCCTNTFNKPFEVTYDSNTNSWIINGMSFTWNDMIGDIDFCPTVKMCETVTSINDIILNGTSLEITYTNESGSAQLVSVDLSTLGTYVSSITTSSTELIVTQSNKSVINVDLCDIVKSCETITTLIDNGNNTFTYTSEDGTKTTIDLCNCPTITYTADAVDKTVIVDTDKPTFGNITGKDIPCDSGTTTYLLATQPVNGSILLGADGSFLFWPAGTFYAADSFTYHILCNGIIMDTATVTLITSQAITLIDTSGTITVCDGVSFDYNAFNTIDLSFYGGSNAVTVTSDSDIKDAFTALGITVTIDGCTIRIIDYPSVASNVEVQQRMFKFFSIAADEKDMNLPTPFRVKASVIELSNFGAVQNTSLIGSVDIYDSSNALVYTNSSIPFDDNWQDTIALPNSGATYRVWYKVYLPTGELCEFNSLVDNDAAGSSYSITGANYDYTNDSLTITVAGANVINNAADSAEVDYGNDGINEITGPVSSFTIMPTGLPSASPNKIKVTWHYGVLTCHKLGVVFYQ